MSQIPNPDWQLSAYDFELPSDRIAQHPTPTRDESRLLLLPLQGSVCTHHRFSEIVRLLPDNACLILNNTRVIPARLLGRRPSGAQIEALLLEEQELGKWSALVRKAKRIREGEWLAFGETLNATAIQRQKDGSWILQFENPSTFRQRLEQEGLPPLPPYIRRTNERSDTLAEDRQRYQTVFAQEAGAVAAPTAGLHFTPEILAQLRQRGIPILEVTLHVGRGTFLPVQVEDPRLHQMHEESYSVLPETWEALHKYRAEGRQLIAVGTTVVRVLETLARQTTPQLQGRTQIFIYPPYEFQLVDGLLTNFHLPKSTLLMLVSALCGRQRLLETYQEALREKYRFFSYGDCMLLI